MPGMSNNLRQALFNRHRVKPTDWCYRLLVIAMLSFAIFIIIVA